MPDIKTYLPSQIDAREATISATYEFHGYEEKISVEVPEAENYLVNGKIYLVALENGSTQMCDKFIAI